MTPNTPDQPRRLFCHRLLAALGLAAGVWAPSVAEQPAVLLAKDWSTGRDPSRYLISEKLDGVRALWDGKTLRFRSGRVVAAPAWFLARLPAEPLDGELWLARGQFERLSGMVRKSQAVEADWREIQYRVFELPGAGGTFAQRAQQLQALATRLAWPQLQAVAQVRVASAAALQERLQAVLKAGGEGLMLHHEDAPVQGGRSDALLKLKARDDAEARVIAHEPGKGKYAGQLGGLKVQTPEGRQFVIGTGFSDAERLNPPPVGSAVTYTYQGLTRTGLPRFASFLRVRNEP
ncbi:DNA ligase [Roseateles toxinivorans]|uniref:DNA ligase n=1 Tax=Roseateles toxinivorans TaxID=270368 RepID=UPI00105D37D6|nr:DNA ligase [Roseateles toxinivorans]